MSILRITLPIVALALAGGCASTVRFSVVASSTTDLGGASETTTVTRTVEKGHLGSPVTTVSVQPSLLDTGTRVAGGRGPRQW